MKKLGDIMKDLGFREEASQGTKQAFIKHLIKAANGAEAETPAEKRERQRGQNVTAVPVSRPADFLPKEKTNRKKTVKQHKFVPSEQLSFAFFEDRSKKIVG